MKKSLCCVSYSLIVFLLVFVFSIIVNYAVFGDPLSPLEEQLVWIPILRAPLVEESSKLILIYRMKKKEKVSGNEFIRLAGNIGNWYFVLENLLVYIWLKKISFSDVMFRLFPGHINYAILDAFGLKDGFSKRRLIFPALAMFLHVVHNLLGIYHFQLYVMYGVLSIILFVVILVRTPVR